MSPSEREFGELRSEVRGVASAIADMVSINSREHAVNDKRLKGIEDRIDSLEGTRDKLIGAKSFLVGIATAAFTLLGIFIGSH